MRPIQVDLGDRSYSIRIESGLLDHLGAEIRRAVPQPSRAVIVTDRHVGRLYGPRVDRALRRAGFPVDRITFAGGERNKTLPVASATIDRLVALGADRHTLLVALGGGIVGDLTGFVASIYMRGIPFVQVPTSMLAQVDASVGGKVAVDHPRAKNMIGSFYQPRGVFTDPTVLRTLPEREYIAGLAEVVKSGMIGNPDLFAWLERSAADVLAHSEAAILHCISAAAGLKAAVCSRDERETGERVILNYGHTVGHALETATGYDRFRHGEAVSVGMDVEARLAERLKLCPPGIAERQRRVLATLGLPIRCPRAVQRRIMEAMKHDKKSRAGRMRFVLPVRIGEVKVVPDVPQEEVWGVLQGDRV
ncbi:MAG: 3-dehydroquinate synthase [Planctomycetes bacterium]|nr:3-dehydroquinate synthase [Planctomycetota bacterium]